MLNKLKSLQKLRKMVFSDSKQVYVSQMYNKWLEDKNQIHPDWNNYFMKYQPLIQKDDKNDFNKKLIQIVDLYRKNGMFLANLSPVSDSNNFKSQNEIIQLLEQQMLINQEEMNEKINLPSSIINTQPTTPRELIDQLKEIYTKNISYQYMNIPNQNIRKWIQDRIEIKNWKLDKQEKIQILEVLLESQSFNDFFQKQYPNRKSYTCEGIDTFISGMKEVINTSHKLGIRSVDIAMANRGRLNLLNVIANKPAHQIFSLFNDQTKSINQNDNNFIGDVAYHQSAYSKMNFPDGKDLTVNIAPNPCHLESIYPVLLGSIKSKLVNRNWKQSKILPVIIHGDVSITGQGIVFEAQALEQLQEFDVGGTVHIVLNNQQGKDQLRTRSSFFPSNIANINRNFVIYVNAQEPELVNRAIQLAIEYRQEWKRDVFVELIGFKRYENQEVKNEGMVNHQYIDSIKQITPVHIKYSNDLIKQKIVDENYIQNLMKNYQKNLQKEYDISLLGNVNIRDNYLKNQKDMILSVKQKHVSKNQLEEIGSLIKTLPKDKSIHPIIIKDYKERLKSIKTGKKIKQATAESLAFGSLMRQGYSIRLTGEDVERGTFSHRHIKLTDQKTNQQFLPLEQLQSDNTKIVVKNSCLEELGVLGFEYGYSVNAPLTLTIWEAQFGDFTNGAQVIVDQFISSCETKWGRTSGIVLNLPHGYDGQGPEHSNARIERFLSSVSDDYQLMGDKEERKGLIYKTNMVVCNITNSANYFHLIRKQMTRSFRKPLVLLASKKLLRHSAVESEIEDFLEPNKFKKIISQNKTDAKKIILCSGQVFVDAEIKRQKDNLQEEVEIMRFEQLGPFPYIEFDKMIKNYKNKNADILYLQEEQFNFGAFTYLQPRINLILKENGFNQVRYVGRGISSSTSTGFSKVHEKERVQIIEEAFK